MSKFGASEIVAFSVPSRGRSGLRVLLDPGGSQILPVNPADSGRRN